MAEIILCFIWALVISLFAMPSIIYVAQSKKLLNHPNERTTHIVSVPRLGGLAIFAGFLSSVMIFGRVEGSVQHLIAGCIVLFYIAVKDDLVAVSAFKKFFVQILATGILIFLGDFRITNFHGLLGIHELSNGVSYAFTMVTVLALTNSVNLIDGINGLAGSLIVISACILAVILYFVASEQPLVLVSIALAGAVLGFLRYNFGEAQIFMGDTGSLVCGFILAALLIRFIEIVPFPNAPILAMSIVFVPIADTLRITIIRIINGRSPFSSDKNHIHHKLLFAGLSPVSIVLILSGLNLSVFFLFWSMTSVDVNTNLLAFLAILLAVVLLFHFLKEKKNSQENAS
jgi:UDP-N-acetylmuramyl pentapeptide phosphotransferase/UDP-N-acetylglucosamine-1-phosphate transferase